MESDNNNTTTTSLSLLPNSHSNHSPRMLPSPAHMFVEAMQQPGNPIWMCAVLFRCTLYFVLALVLRRLFDFALTAWASMPPANQVVVEAGSLRIEFGCVNEPVPWEFLRDFAASKRNAVERGFAEVFEREWWFEKRIGTAGGGGEGEGDRERKRVCYVGMRVVEEGRVVVPPG